MKMYRHRVRIEIEIRTDHITNKEVFSIETDLSAEEKAEKQGAWLQKKNEHKER